MTEVKTLTLQEGVASLLAAQNPAKPEDETPKQEAEPEAPEMEEDEGPDPEGSDEGEPEGEDPTEEDVPDEVEETEPFYAVNVDGEERKVKLKDLIDGYRRGHNYETKAEKLREEREAAQRELAAVTQKRTEYDQRLSALEAILSQDDPDLQQLKAKDPARYLLIKEERAEALRKVQTERQKVAGEHVQHVRAEMVKHVEAEKQRMLDAIPVWRDEKRRADEQPKITAFAKSIGFTDQELAGLVDHRAVVVLRDAWLHRQGQGLKSKQAPKGSKAIPAGTPKTKTEITGRERDKAFERLKRSGKPEDAVRLLLTRK